MSETKFTQGEYCPRCGAQKVCRSAISLSEKHYVCAICHSGFSDSVRSRWNAKKFKGTNFCRDKPIVEIINPHNLKLHRKRLKEECNRQTGYFKPDDKTNFEKSSPCGEV